MKPTRTGVGISLVIVMICGLTGCRQTSPSLASALGLSGGGGTAPAAGGLNPTLSGPASPFAPASTSTASGVLTPSFTPDTTVSPPTSTTLGVPTAIGGGTGPATPYFPSAPFPSSTLPTATPNTSSVGPTPSPVQTVASSETFGSVPMGAARLAQRTQSSHPASALGSALGSDFRNGHSHDFQVRSSDSPASDPRSLVASSPIGSGVRPANFVETSAQSLMGSPGPMQMSAANATILPVQPAGGMSSPMGQQRDDRYQTLPPISPVRTGNLLRDPVPTTGGGSNLSWRRPGTGPN